MKKPQAIFTAILTPFSLVVALASVEHKQTTYTSIHYSQRCVTQIATQIYVMQTPKHAMWLREFAIATEH